MEKKIQKPISSNQQVARKNSVKIYAGQNQEDYTEGYDETSSIWAPSIVKKIMKNTVDAIIRKGILIPFYPSSALR